jgi:hypothetical protein
MPWRLYATRIITNVSAGALSVGRWNLPGAPAAVFILGRDAVFTL